MNHLKRAMDDKTNRRAARAGATNRMLLVFAAAAICLLPRMTVANQNGINGVSGRFGNTVCDACHKDGVTPLVEFEAPDGTQFIPEALATFRFKITSQSNNQTHAGFDVNATGGTLIVSDPGTQLLGFGPTLDITHTGPRQNDANKVAVFEFNWRAPAATGTYTLFGAGNSVNFDHEDTGDASARTTLSIIVAAMATPTPTPSATETPTGASCTGDCDGSGDVTVDEIVRGVNIALGSLPVEDCPSLDRDGSGTVTVDEIIEAIDNALSGCG